MRTWLDANAPAGRRIEIVIGGETAGKRAASRRKIVEPFAEAGADWWIESIWSGKDEAKLFKQIRRGPPLDA